MGGVETMAAAETNGHGLSYGKKAQKKKEGKASAATCGGGGGYYGFQMPLHYPRYSKKDYETMPEWKLDLLLAAYGLPVTGDVAEKRRFAMGAFLWDSN